jgi:hypothetical protein
MEVKPMNAMRNMAIYLGLVADNRPDPYDLARDRLRRAEQQLAESLRSDAHPDSSLLNEPSDSDGGKELIVDFDLSEAALLGSAAAALERVVPLIRPEDRLALPALWEVTHSRLDLYHQIATGQARDSFRNAQRAMWAGFVLLAAFAVLAALSRSTAAAITTAALGGVSAAFAGYISRTFVRSQESAASHLRAYFDQPLEFSRYLAAERLMASLDGLSIDARTTAADLILAIADTGAGSLGSPTASKVTRNKSKDKPSQ